MESDIEQRQFVRAYSFEAEQRLPAGNDGHVLAHALTQTEASFNTITEPWRKFFEPWKDGTGETELVSQTLCVEAAKLQKQWQYFHRLLPKEERVDINTEGPSVQGIIDIVNKASKSWQAERQKGKRGKARTYFHRFCGTLDAHNNMMKILPSGNEYVSLFTGSVTAIIKASVNHEKIADDIAQALYVISEHVASCEIDLKLFKTEDMMKELIDLYANVFLFLNDTMDWYLRKRRKRLVDSFNEKFFDHFQEKIDNIIRRSEFIKKLAMQSSQAEIRVARMLVEKLGSDVRVGLDGISRQEAEIAYLRQQLKLQVEKERLDWQEEKKYLSNLHQSMISFLMDATSSHDLKYPKRGLISASTTAVGSFVAPMPLTMTREEILTRSACMEDFFDRKRIRLSSDHFTAKYPDAEAVARLTDWIISPDSSILNISGPYFEGDEYENSMSLLAAKFIEFADRSKVPVISYFCDLVRRKYLRSENTQEVQSFGDMVYSLIHQTSEFVAPILDTERDFTSHRFQKLDGTAVSLNDALALLQDVLSLLGGKVLCVVNGLQWTDSRSTSEYTERLVKILREGNMKMLFTTSGDSRTLQRSLSRHETFLVQSSWKSKEDDLWEIEEGSMIL